MFCKNCGEPLNENQAICLKCGFKVGDGRNYCAYCGAPLQPGAACCPTCGAPVIKTGNNLNGQDKVTMAIICFFLGGLGVHNFMMGEKKKGILRLCTCCIGVGGVLALIDFVKILTDSYTVDPNALI